MVGGGIGGLSVGGIVSGIGGGIDDGMLGASDIATGIFVDVAGGGVVVGGGGGGIRTSAIVGAFV